MRKVLIAAAALIGFAAPSSAYSDVQIATMLRANPWCLVIQNKTSGRSYHDRAVFNGGGKLLTTHREMAGSRDVTSEDGLGREDVSHWKVDRGDLFLSGNGEVWALEHLAFEHNGRGERVLVRDGWKWTACR